MSLAQEEDASGHPKAAMQQRRAVMLIHLGTPQDIAQARASALESKLPAGMRVFAAAYHGRPTIAETLEQVVALGFEAVIAVSMHPPYSRTTTLPLARELYRQVERSGCTVDVTMRGVWYDDAGYINAQARLLHEFAGAHGLGPDNACLAYALRSIPTADADGGDPYLDQVHRTAELVGRRLGWPADRSTLGFVDDSGSSEGLQPTMSEVLADLSQAGEKQVLVCALGFTTDCPEVPAAGIQVFPCPGLNTYEPFISALRNLVLHGRHPVSFGQTAAGLMAATRSRRAQVEGADAPIASLFMVGMSLGGRLGPGQGPTLAHADANALRQVKRRQCDVPDLLRAVCRDEAIREAWIWNTCRRFELYGWLRTSADDAQRADVIALIRRELLGRDGRDPGAALDVLHGADAWHHLMRTAAGLNSGLPGEREVLQQLQAAHRLAGRAGTAGPLTERLMAEVSEHERRLRDQTEWGRFTPSYCHAAITGIAPSIGRDLAGCRCVVIGGSTTSCGILEALTERFGVPRRRLTLLHRGHGHDGHLKMLRKAIGSGRRRRVHKYSEKLVIDAIADADAVFIGLDRREPVLDAARIRTCRDFAARPLAIVDFNMFGSTLGLEGLDGVRVWTADALDHAAAAFAADMCGRGEFGRAAEAAEAWIRERIPAPVGT
ncbi:MAG: ferrochelatase [Planctomycetota bacterium]|jgi:protoheme ferro-lyase/glutamyl-tRNA reductase